MPDNHEIVKAEAWAPAALGLLHREIVLAGLVQRDTGAAFTGAALDTVNIRRPSRLAAVTEALRAMDSSGYAIESESLNESSIAVQLDRHVYSAVDLSDAQLTLDIADYGAQVLMPQSRAIATRLEYIVAAAMNGLTPSFTATGSDFEAVRRAIVRLRRELNENDVPADGRVLVIGVDVEEVLLRDPHLTRQDQAGTDSALRNAEVARLYGFRVVVSNTLDSDRMVAFHPSAWTMVSRAPVVPESATGRSESYEGFALRAIRDYNSRTAQDRSLISTFAGLGETTDRTVTYSSDGTPTISDDFTMVRAVAATLSEEDPEPDPSP